MFDRNRTRFRVANARGAAWLVAMVAAIVLVAAFIEVRVYQQLDAAASTERNLVRAQSRLDAVLESMLDEETGLRGYLATAKSDFLDPAVAGGVTFDLALGQFQATARAAGFAGLADSAAEMRALHQRWEAEVERPLLKAPRRKDAVTLEQLGKLYVDQLRADVSQDESLLERRNGSAEAQLKARINEAVIGGLVAIVGFAWLGFAFITSRAQMMEVIDRERGIVETLQGAFRTDLETLPNSRIGAAYLSATQDAAVGGDLYDVRRLDTDRGLLLVADVSGKGVEAAVNTAFVKYAMRTLALTADGPGALLGAFNRVFLDTVLDPSVFVVAFVGVYDARSLELHYASAGHAGAYLRRAGEVVQLGVTGPIVGLAADSAYEQRVLALRPGDLLVLATDGLTEARDRAGELLDDEGAMALLRETSGDPQTCADELVTAVRARSGGQPADDLALLVVAFDGPEPSVHTASPGAAA